MKILLIRSAPIEQCDRILNEIKSDSLEHDITVLTNVATTGNIVQRHSVRIYNYDARSINIFSIGIDNIKRLRTMSFDKVIIVCRNHLGDGYGHIKIVALLVGAQEVELWNVNGAKFTITAPRLLFTILFWKSYMALHFMIWGILIVRDAIQKIRSRFLVKT